MMFSCENVDNEIRKALQDIDVKALCSLIAGDMALLNSTPDCPKNRPTGAVGQRGT